MIKKLRMKFVAVNMVIATVMLCVILGMVYSFTSGGLERESLNMMYNIASHPIGLGTPDIPGEGVRLPYFKIQLGPSGELITAGGGYYDLTDHDFLENLIDTALKSPKNFGVLKEYKLRYYRMDDLMNHCIVFADMSSELMTLQHLLKHSLIVGMAGFLLLLAISIWLSGWAVRPVERAWKQQKQFVADASHELKTPLTAISGYAELIASGMTGGEDTAHFANEIHKSAERLQALINDIIKLSELDDSDLKLEFETVDLHDLGEQCIHSMQMQADKNEVTLHLEGASVPINGNKTLLEELLFNLCSNAVRYNKKGGSVTIVTTIENTRPVLIVKDTGIGIPKEQQERVFERFYRVDKSRSKSTGGTGLGLAIVKHIVAQHDAQMTLTSEVGVGTEIKIVF